MFNSITMLFYLQQAIKRYSDVYFNKSNGGDFFSSHFQYKTFPHQFSYKHSSTVSVRSIKTTRHLWNISFWCYTQNCTYCINWWSKTNLLFCATFSMERREMWKFKKSQFQKNIEIFKRYFKIFTYEYIWEFLTPNILTSCLHYLLSDIWWEGGKCSQSTQLVRRMLYPTNETTCFGL